MDFDESKMVLKFPFSDNLLLISKMMTIAPLYIVSDSTYMYTYTPIAVYISMTWIVEKEPEDSRCDYYYYFERSLKGKLTTIYIYNYGYCMAIIMDIVRDMRYDYCS